MIPYKISPSRWMSLGMLLFMMLSMLGPIEKHSLQKPIGQAIPIAHQALPAHKAETAKPSSAESSAHHGEPSKLGGPTVQKPPGNGYEKLLQALQVDRLELDKVKVTATGYTAGPESTGKSKGHPEYGITYSGVKVRRGLVSTVAADPSLLPLGTLLYIPGYGYGVVADTGSAIRGKKIDLYFETRHEVFAEWGKKSVDVVILKKGDGKVTEDMLDELNEAFLMMKQGAASM